MILNKEDFVLYKNSYLKSEAKIYFINLTSSINGKVSA